MSDKYIIRNCPATGPGCCGYTCPEITDCVLKQIVEKCKNNQYPIFNKKLEMIGYEKSPLSKEILQLLDIKEVE